MLNRFAIDDDVDLYQSHDDLKALSPVVRRLAMSVNYRGTCSPRIWFG